MRIIVDAFGGDNAPLEIIKGCAEAADELNVKIILVGSKEKIEKCAGENFISLENMEIKDAPDIMIMTDHPREILKEKSNTSMAVGLKSLAEGEGDAFVSAGSTGAAVIGASFIVKRIKGIKRPAIATVLPSNSGPFMMLDSGANADCTAEYLYQFGLMGSIYMNRIMGVESPRVALANIGTEDTKGDKLRIEAFEKMKEASYNFIGNIEARDIPLGCADVVVADGFTGNVILKMYEGVAGLLMHNIKMIFKKNKLTMLSALMVKGGLKDLKKRMDYSEFGGAPLMGISAPVIKAHGSSNAKAIKNAIRQATDYVEKNVINAIAENIGV
ncbi:MAG: phosphate acyltransferase PlsX [Clostridiales bacterium]|nr:phosphate acyltransferase PlsX [Clostridiales bacterium]